MIQKLGEELLDLLVSQFRVIQMDKVECFFILKNSRKIK